MMNTSAGMADKPDENQELARAVARLRAGVLSLLFAAMGGLGLFGMTVWLIVKGGIDVGKHLQLLGNYFVGYSVSWPGAFIGLFYGALVGGVLGWVIAFIYNRVVWLRQR